VIFALDPCAQAVAQLVVEQVATPAERAERVEQRPALFGVEGFPVPPDADPPAPET